MRRKEGTCGPGKEEKEMKKKRGKKKTVNG